MVVTCNSFGVSGMDGYKVELEASMYNGTREFDMVGLPDAAVRESKDRVLSALKNCGFSPGVITRRGAHRQHPLEDQ